MYSFTGYVKEILVRNVCICIVLWPLLSGIHKTPKMHPVGDSDRTEGHGATVYTKRRRKGRYILKLKPIKTIKCCVIKQNFNICEVNLVL